MLLYPSEHTSCFNYEDLRALPLQIFTKSSGEQIEGDASDTVFVFFVNGESNLSYSEYRNINVPEGKVILLPPGTHYKISAVNDIHVVMLKIKGIIQLCECMSIDRLLQESMPNKKREVVRKPGMLDIGDDIRFFIAELCKHFTNGLKCAYYVQTKTRELFFLLRAYYEKEKLSAFFAPLLSDDARFTFFIYNNYRKVKNLQEFIAISTYSESAFKKKFKKSFGIPASTWLRKQKAMLIFHDLNNPVLSIKEISNKYHFSAISSFNAFCIQNFGRPPGRIRSLAKGSGDPIKPIIGKSD